MIKFRKGGINRGNNIESKLFNVIECLKKPTEIVVIG